MDSQFVALDVEVEASHLFEGLVRHVELVRNFRRAVDAKLGDLDGKKRRGRGRIGIGIAAAASTTFVVIDSDFVHSVLAPKVQDDSGSKGRLYLFSDEFSTGFVDFFDLGRCWWSYVLVKFDANRWDDREFRNRNRTCRYRMSIVVVDVIAVVIAVVIGGSSGGCGGNACCR